MISGNFADQLEHSGLARQVSALLANHLTRATECSGNEAAGNEALHEVLSLLNSLSRYSLFMCCETSMMLEIIFRKLVVLPITQNLSCLVLCRTAYRQLSDDGQRRIAQRINRQPSLKPTRPEVGR